MKYDIEGLANELEIDLESISGLYTSYIEEMEGEIADMQAYLDKSDWVMLERVIHNVKGVSANLGISDVFSEADKFDILLKKNEVSDSKEYVSKIIKLINASELEINEFFKEKGINI